MVLCYTGSISRALPIKRAASDENNLIWTGRGGDRVSGGKDKSGRREGKRWVEVRGMRKGRKSK